MNFPFKDTDATTRMLYWGIWVSLVALIVSDRALKADAQVFQVIAGVLTGFVGGFLARVKPPEDKKVPPQA